MNKTQNDYSIKNLKMQSILEIPSQQQSYMYRSQFLEEEEQYDVQTFSEELSYSINNHEGIIFDSSFKSYEIQTESLPEVEVIQKQYNYPKKQNPVHHNHLELKREFSKTEGKKSSTEFEAFLLILKYFFSVGILVMPYMYQLTGYILGSALILFTSIMTIYSVQLVTEVHSDIQRKQDELINQNNNYPHIHQHHHIQKINASLTDVAYRVFGVSGQMVCRIFGFINNFGGCISYIIFFEIYISNIIQEYFMINISKEQAHLVGVLIAFAIILPFSHMNHLSLFWQTNLIGLFLGMGGITCMMYSDWTFINQIGAIKGDNNSNDLWKTDHIFIAMGVVVYSLQIIPIALNVRDCMEKPQHFMPVFQVSTFFTCFTYIAFGIITHYAIGEYVDDVVLLNYAPQTILGFIVRFCYTLSILLSYPLKFYVVIQIYENLKIFKDKVFCQERYNNHEYECVYTSQFALVKRFGIRYLMVLTIFILSLMTLKLAKLISLLGSLGALVLQYILPQLIYIKHFDVPWYRTIFGIAMSIFFLIASCLGVYHSIKNF